MSLCSINVKECLKMSKSKSYFNNNNNNNKTIIIIIIILIITIIIIIIIENPREVAKLWNVRVQIIPVIIGAFGTIPNDLEERINKMGLSLKTAQIQMSVLFGTARFRRNVLEI